jgi:TRAF3-interacting protein 1
MQAEAEIPEWVLDTQKTLGTLISKPKLSEKLLGKPPIKFLHDIVMEIIHTTGFAASIFTPDECDPTNLTVRDEHYVILSSG